VNRSIKEGKCQTRFPTFASMSDMHMGRAMIAATHIPVRANCSDSENSARGPSPGFYSPRSRAMAR
jgi:hypothetical protein